MRHEAAIAAMLATILPLPAFAASTERPSPVEKLAAIVRSGATAGRGDTDDGRWEMPAIEAVYEKPTPPRLRIRGKKIKLRVPLG